MTASVDSIDFDDDPEQSHQAAPAGIDRPRDADSHKSRAHGHEGLGRTCPQILTCAFACTDNGVVIDDNGETCAAPRDLTLASVKLEWSRPLANDG